MRRVLLIIAGLLILLGVAAPSAAVYYALFTESGLQFIVRQIPHRLGGVRLDIVNVSGTIAHGIRAERVEIEHERVHLRFEGIAGRVSLLPLLWQTIRTRDSVIRSAYVEVRRRTRPLEKSPPFFLPRWLIVSAERARLGSAVIVAPNGYRLEATNLLASGVARHRTIRFFEAAVDLGELHFNGIGVLRATDPMQLDAEGRFDWTPAGQPAWSVASTGHGDLASLAVTARFMAPFSADFSGHALELTRAWHIAGEGQVHSLDLGAWGLKGPLGILTARLAVQGGATGFSARGVVNSSGLHVGPFDGEFAGRYANRVLTATRIDLVHKGSGAHATGAGTIGIVRHGPKLDLQGTWQDFRWPLVGKESFRSSSGEFALSGVLPYAIRANGIANIAPLAPMPVQLNGTLAKDRFEFKDTRVAAFDSHAVLGGLVVWTPEERWSVAGDVSGFNPARLRDDLPGALNFSMSADGRGFSQAGSVSLEIRDLSGRLRGAAATGGGKLVRAPQGWKFDAVRVGLGRTNIALDGTVADEMDLRFAIKAEDLSLLAPDSRGQLEATGSIRGSLKDPTIAASAHGSDIHHQGVTLEGLDADIDFDPREQHESKVVARLHNLQYSDRKLESLTFSLNGPPTRYAVRLDARTNGLALSAQGAGPYSQGVWDGQLDKLTVNGTESLHLELTKPVGMLVSADHLRAQWLCLVGTPVSVCADAEWTAAQWATTLTANDLPINTLTTGLTRSVEYSGKINGQVRMFGSNAEAPQGTIRLDLVDAHIIHRLTSGKIENTTLGSGLITVNATHSTLAAEVGLDAGDIGGIKGSLTAQRTTPQWENMPVTGELHAHTGELGLITLYVPDIDRAAGTLNADVQFAGTLGIPRVYGTLKLADGEIDFYQVNLGLRQAGFEARLSDTGLDFAGTTHIGQGVATAHGHMDWRNSLPYGKFHLEGTGLRVVDIPEAQINASPDLDFSIEGRKIEVTGAVKVPYAKIVPADLKGAVLASSDEVLVGQQREDPANRFQVMSNITLSLGEKVSVETSGLSGRLTGNITVHSDYDEVTRGTGELSIEEGKYNAYARKLDIQRGRLIFTGGPIQDPGIDLRAIKEFPDVTAGINVRGTLQQPRISFFSDPSLPQSQIVSLILSGGGLESVQNQKSGNEALAQGGAILAQQLGSRIGIEDVSLETDLTNETSLVVGKFLSPRLYVSYGVSLTEQLNTLKLRYTLGDHWTVKTEVGTARGADLVYTIDK